MRISDWSSDVCSSDLKPQWTGSFFTGIPSPAGAGVSLLFLILSQEVDSEFFRSPVLNALWLLLVGGLMVSRVPTFSFKRVRVKREHVGLGIGRASCRERVCEYG